MTGRRKDLIILHGRNLYPQDIEQTIERSHARRAAGMHRGVLGRAPRRGTAGSGGRDPAPPRRQHDGAGGATSRHRRDCRSRGGRARSGAHIVLLLPPGAIPKTSSGKIQRSACKAGFLAGELEVLADGSAEGGSAAHVRRARTPLEDTVAAVWADLLNVNQVDLYDNFFEQGGHSLLATQLLGRLRMVCGVDVPCARCLRPPPWPGFRATSTRRDSGRHLDAAAAAAGS